MEIQPLFLQLFALYTVKKTTATYVFSKIQFSINTKRPTRDEQYKGNCFKQCRQPIVTQKIKHIAQKLHIFLKYVTLKRLILCIVAFFCFLPSFAGEDLARTMQMERLMKAEEALTESFALHYRVNATEIDETYMTNREQIHKIRHYLVNSPRIDSITLYSWASPEGRYSVNARLSRKRGEAAKRLLLSLSPDSLKFNSGKIKMSPVAEKWG